MLDYLIKLKLFINKLFGKKQKLLFLDFDGVINIGNDYLGKDIPYLANKECINNLNELCHKFNLEIVISSSHRFNGLDYCKTFLYESGLDKNIKIIGKTQTEEIMPRYKEIYLYLKNNREVIDFIILDDIKFEKLNDFIVNTKFSTGFNKECLKVACEKLSKYVDLSK